MKLPVLSILAILFVFSCKPPTPKSTYKFESKELGANNYIELKKGPCFGFCPVYEVKISGNGKVVYNGKKNVEKEGVWYRTLTAKQTNDLFKAFVDVDYWSFQDEYTAQVTDLATTWTTLFLDDKTKTIKDYYGAPKALKKLEDMVAQLAEEEEGWQHDAGTD